MLTDAGLVAPRGILGTRRSVGCWAVPIPRAEMPEFSRKAWAFWRMASEMAADSIKRARWRSYSDAALRRRSVNSWASAGRKQAESERRVNGRVGRRRPGTR